MMTAEERVATVSRFIIHQNRTTHNQYVQHSTGA
jgi:hypothetical protein